jgi:diaminohydroxyphosphoribosylaminopyrimidine deaminase/5-amino-6-(5-phosphoribosylamino)uracil reductase
VRVVFDRRLRASPAARLFSTLPAGPVIIITSRDAVRSQAERAAALTRAGVGLEVADTLADALTVLAGKDVQSVLLEGGAALHQAAWEERLVDYVQLYVAPMAVGHGTPLAPGPASAIASLQEQTIRMLGPDVLIEGYVHRPH